MDIKCFYNVRFLLGGQRGEFVTNYFDRILPVWRTIADGIKTHTSGDQFHYENHRNPDPERRMQGFVMKYMHTDETTDTSTKDSDGKQCGFPDPPFMMDSFVFVDAKSGKAGQIDNGQIRKNTGKCHKNLLIYINHCFFRKYRNRGNRLNITEPEKMSTPGAGGNGKKRISEMSIEM